MRQLSTLVTALTVICIASVCLAGLVTFMLWREAGRMLHHGKPLAMVNKDTALIGLAAPRELP